MPWRFNPFTGNLDETDIPAFNGEVTLGSAASPSIFFTGDTNTGLYSPGADQVALSTNGTQQLLIDSQGRVGIGGNGIGTGLGVYLQRGSGTSTHFYEASDGTKKMIAGIDATLTYAKIGSLSNHDLGFVTNNGLKMLITSAGLVGIGTSSPATLVEGRITGGGGTPASSGTSQPNAVFRVSGSGTTGVLDIGCNSGAPWIQSTDRTDLSLKYDLLLNPNGGRVGIGTTSPARQLHVAGEAVVFNTNQFLISPTTDNVRLYARDSSTGPQNLSFNIGITEVARIDSSGRVGIGTSSPDHNLDLIGTTTSAFRIRSNASATRGFELWNDSDTDKAYISNYYVGSLIFQTNNTPRAEIDSSGRLLVGTSSDSGGALLQVNGDRIRVATAKTPASASDTGAAGEICWDASYIYVCTATNTWKRAALSTW